MGMEEVRGNRKVAGQICQNGFRGSKKHTRLYLEIRSGKAKCGDRDKKKGSQIYSRNIKNEGGQMA